ncbi:MAG: hypothetical protein ACI9F2_000576 [Lysobacterales bacterium]
MGKVREETQKGFLELEAEHKQLLIEKTKLENSFLKLTDKNNYLSEKERIIQYELIKSRAHSLGLERVCEDLTAQMDRLNL